MLLLHLCTDLHCVCNKIRDKTPKKTYLLIKSLYSLEFNMIAMLNLMGRIGFVMLVKNLLTSFK